MGGYIAKCKIEDGGHVGNVCQSYPFTLVSVFKAGSVSRNKLSSNEKLPVFHIGGKK